MSDPIAISYNLGRLGQSGDEIVFAASDSERVALARFTGVLEVAKFDARIALSKLSPTRFALSYELAADVMQACVVTLEPLAAHITKSFVRELHYAPSLRRGLEKEVVLSPEDEEVPEEITSLHFDLAGPLVEEFALALDPYPRAPGVEFTAPEGVNEPPESPFAALKGLKSGQESKN